MEETYHSHENSVYGKLKMKKGISRTQLTKLHDPFSVKAQIQ